MLIAVLGLTMAGCGVWKDRPDIEWPTNGIPWPLPQEPQTPTPEPEEPAGTDECDTSKEVRPPHSLLDMPALPAGVTSCGAVGSIWKPRTVVCENGQLTYSGECFICPNYGTGKDGKPNYQVSIFSRIPTGANKKEGYLGELIFKTNFGRRHVWKWSHLKDVFKAQPEPGLYVVERRGTAPIGAQYVREWLCRED